MQLEFRGGTFISGKGELNYQAVLDDFPKAKIIRIITFNISRNQRYDALLEALSSSKADIQFITNVPSRVDEYYNTPAGQRMRDTARRNIQTYISKLNPEHFSKTFEPFFNPNNHAKLVGTENIVYIGSANYSNESANNIESGVLIKDRDFIRKLYEDFFDTVKEESISYYDESFSAFRLFILALNTKFQYHHRKMLSELFTDYQKTKMTVADSVLLDISDLDDLYCDLVALSSFSSNAEETYDDTNQEYNSALDKLKAQFEEIDIGFLTDTLSEGGNLYRLVAYDYQSICDDIWQKKYSSEAFSEELVDHYMQKAVDEATEIYSALHDSFQEDADIFIAELEKILSVLQRALSFTEKWKPAKINPEIDNT